MPSLEMEAVTAPLDLLVVRALLVCIFTSGLASTSGGQQLADNSLTTFNFLGMESIANEVGRVAQMTFGPDGKLYVATFGDGVVSYDYAPSGELSNRTTVWSRTEDIPNGVVNGSLGVAFHEDPTLGTVMYISPAVTSFFNVEDNFTQSIVRLTDSDGDGNWGELADGEINQAIADNLRVTDLHQVNQLLIKDDTLYAGIGSRTRTGGEVSEYPDAPNPDDGEFAYTGAINWIRDLTQLSDDTTTSNTAGFDSLVHHTDTRPFTSADTGKLTVYSTGFRNVYGLAFDSDDQLWATMNQNENPLKPDELHQSNFQDDHKFPKGNEVSGDWKSNADAMSAGFFSTFKNPVALLGNHASADGLAFTNANDELSNYVFLVRFASGKDLLAIDKITGDITTIAQGFANPLDVISDPMGNLLVGQYGEGGEIFRLNALSGPFADLDESGSLDLDDWNILKQNFNSDLSNLTKPEAYLLGDLNGDLVNNEYDFALFKEAVETQGGFDSLSQLVNAVPESSTSVYSVSIFICAVLAVQLRPRHMGMVR
ncbi:hypothetical protein NG895_10560 [Aeoliella sp. ICT_H6.2]|uniref:Uncharacterized protein n=2 Tax=Aeoliella straminimaris TaxID=2954799 RepID=A0A9X2F9Y8_9BACT|nr:hypothetical protein [Aeoliella straminimaris]